MGRKLISVLKWLLPGLLVVLGGLLHIAGHGYEFSGLICFGIAGVLVCYYLIAILAKNHLVPAKVLRTVLSGLLVLGILVVGLTELVVLSAASGTADQSCEYLLVLGAGVRGTEPSVILQSRIDKASEYLKEHPDVICIATGGQGEHEDITEAQCIFDRLVAAGIAPERIWKEEAATSTYENFVFSLALIQEKTGAQPEKLGILSSEFHLCRATIFARECGVEDPVCIPARTPWFIQRLNYFLREAAGIWHYILLGD